MKVLMFGWEFPPVISGGLGTACYGLTEGLSQLNIDVMFVVPRSLRGYAHEHVRLIDSQTYHDSAAEETVDDRWVHIKAIDSFLIPYMTEKTYKEMIESVLSEKSFHADPEVIGGMELYGENIFDEVFRYGKIARTIGQNEHFDIVHCHDWMTIPAGIEAREASKKPFILHIHSLESDRSDLHMNERIYGIERLGMREADRIIAVSHYTKKKIVEQYGIEDKKIRVIHNALSGTERRQKIRVDKDSSKKYVLFLGRVTHQKGPDYFIEAADTVIKRAPNVHFIVAGSGDMTGRLKEEVAARGIERNVHFTGFLNGADVEKAYALSDLYVLPSVSEPFGITVLEALNYDVPVIVSRHSGVLEVLEDCETFDFWNTEELAGKILAILGDSDLYKKLIAKEKEKLKHMSWLAAARSVVDVYQGFLSS
jgi:glycogen(starch) synthase